VGHVVHIGRMRKATTVLVRKPERKRPLETFRYRRKDNRRMDLAATVCRLKSYGLDSLIVGI